MVRLASNKLHKTSKLGQKFSRVVPKVPTKVRHSVSISKKSRRSKTPPSQSTHSFVISPPADRVIRIHYNDPSVEFENRLNGYGTGPSDLCHYCTFQLVGEGVKTDCGHLCCLRCASVSAGPCAICGEDDLDAFDCNYAHHPAHSLINALLDDDVDETDSINHNNPCRHQNTILGSTAEPMANVNEFAIRWAKDRETKIGRSIPFDDHSMYSTANNGIWFSPTIWNERDRNGNKEKYDSLLKNPSTIHDTSTETTATLAEHLQATIPAAAIEVMVLLSAPRHFQAGNPCISPFRFDKNASFCLGEGMTRLVGLVPITGINKKIIKSAIQTIKKNMESAGSERKCRVGLMVAWDRNHGKGIAAVFLLAQGKQWMISE